jgi:lipopolysaccharide biosynthesis glycosyltransferase
MDWQVKNHPDFTAAYSDPLIVHFAGSVKPWHIHGNRSKYDILWRAKYKEVSGLDLDLIQELKEEDFLPPEHEPIMFENDISRKLFGNLPSSSLPPSE